MSTAEFAEKYGCTIQTVERWCREGEIEGAYQNRPRGKWHIPKDAVPPKSFKKRKNKDLAVMIIIK